MIFPDFERTVKVTTENGREAVNDFTNFERTTKASIDSKETSKLTTEFDFKDSKTKITEVVDDIEKHQQMGDDVPKTLENLKHACVDTGTSHTYCVQNGKDEIDALRAAVCQIDGDKVEADASPHDPCQAP